MNLTRRHFLFSAPAIVAVTSIMPVRTLAAPKLKTVAEINRELLSRLMLRHARPLCIYPSGVAYRAGLVIRFKSWRALAEAGA